MVSTRSSTVPPAESSAEQQTMLPPASPAGQSITLQPPPAREEQLLDQQLNAGQQTEVNLAALLLQQSQLL